MRAVTWQGRRKVSVDNVPDPLGIVEEVGREAGDLKVGDRVVIPFNISWGHCFMCDQGPAEPVRDHAEPRPGHRSRVVRILQAVGRSRRRAG